MFSSRYVTLAFLVIQFDAQHQTNNLNEYKTEFVEDTIYNEEDKKDSKKSTTSRSYDYKGIIHAKLRLTKLQRQEKSYIYVSYGMMTFITFAKEDN